MHIGSVCDVLNAVCSWLLVCVFLYNYILFSLNTVCSELFFPIFTASPKGLKRRTSTSMDVSDLTAIVIKGLTKDYFKKELLTKCFSAYGKIKVSLQPAKEIAVITFDSHVSTVHQEFYHARI